MDVIIPLTQNIKVRVQRVTIQNDGNKQVEWQIAARPVYENGRLGSVMFEELFIEPVDENLATLTPPENTEVELAPGMTLDIGGIPGALVWAWLQWHGEQICNGRKDRIEAIVTGAPADETPDVPQADPDPNVNG